MSEAPNTTPEETQQRVTDKIKKRGKKAVQKNTQSLGKLAVQYVPSSSIQANEYNPNRQSDHEFDLLVKSMEEDGFTQPIVVVKASDPKFKFKIVDGEHRWRASSVLGYEEIPIVEVPMTEAQAKIATLRHNRARGTEDYELTASLMKDLENLGVLDWAQDSLQLDSAEIQRLLDDAPIPDVLGEEEWTEAWEPDTASDNEENQDTVETQDIRGDGSVVSAATVASINAQREKEKKIAEAKSAEERQAIQRDSDIFKIYLSFTGGEAELVKRVLGGRAAEKLVELCEFWDKNNS